MPDRKPFNLAEAQAGAPIETRDGRPAKFIASAPEAQEMDQLVVMVGGHVYCRRSDGIRVGANPDFDIFMAPEPYEPSDEECERWCEAVLDAADRINISFPRWTESHRMLARAHLKETHALRGEK